MNSKHETIFRDILLNTRKPIVLKNFNTNWKCFASPIEEWCKRFDDALPPDDALEFEQMPMRFGDSPQWERYRSKLRISFKDFLNIHSKDSENWTVFNYKRVEEIPEACRYDIDFSCFGFPQAAKDASVWLSSKGANTPCHYDTYGCNVVVQIYGRKQWLLFPPDTNLTPTRVPYEESSVYCQENFFSPKNLDSFGGIRQNAFKCILEERDVLIVPRNWWHYVESLDTSLSVNAWIPLEVDAEAQMQECIVKFIVERMLSGESKEKKQYVLNPNQLRLITSSEELFEILRYLLQSRSLARQNGQDQVYPYNYLSEVELTKLIKNFNKNIRVLEPLQPIEFDNIMLARSHRFIDMQLPDNTSIDPIEEALLNAICHPNVVKVVKDKFSKTISSSN